MGLRVTEKTLLKVVKNEKVLPINIKINFCASSHLTVILFVYIICKFHPKTRPKGCFFCGGTGIATSLLKGLFSAK